MTTITLPKIKYGILKRKAIAYDQIIAVAQETMFAPPPTKNGRLLISKFKKTGRYNNKFLASLERGIKESAYFN